MSFELFCRYWNSHLVEEVNCMLPISTYDPRPVGTRVDDADSHCLPQTHQKNVHELTTPCSLNLFCKTPHYPFQGFESINTVNLLWSPLPDKAIKLLIPGLGRCSGEGSDNTLLYSFLKNPVDRGDWWATVHGVAKSWTRLSNWVYLIQGITDLNAISQVSPSPCFSSFVDRDSSEINLIPKGDSEQ